MEPTTLRTGGEHLPLGNPVAITQKYSEKVKTLYLSVYVSTSTTDALALKTKQDIVMITYYVYMFYNLLRAFIGGKVVKENAGTRLEISSL